ncbi:MAG TPA: alpha/beta hydrolase [Myxococcota bacterium]|nr:alpha/beta hydrolase [Myxococcota bacterium]
MSATYLLLPGLHGNGALYAHFVAALPDGTPTRSVTYPLDDLSYERLIAFVLDQLPEGELVIVAESFSGPVGIGVASAVPDRVVGLVLAATFSEGPLPTWTRPLARLLGNRVNGLIVRSFLVGPSAETELVEEIIREVNEVPGALLVQRAERVLEVDMKEALQALEVPVLYLHASWDMLLWGARNTLVKAAPSTTVVELSSPHLVLQREPAEAARAIQEWLESVKS